MARLSEPARGARFVKGVLRAHLGERVARRVLVFELRVFDSDLCVAHLGLNRGTRRASRHLEILARHLKLPGRRRPARATERCEQCDEGRCDSCRSNQGWLHGFGAILEQRVYPLQRNIEIPWI